MTTHFLFREGEWKGCGQVSFSASPEVLPFTTYWAVSDLGGRQFRAVQKVEIPDQNAQTNVFTITERTPGEFQVFLENDSLGVFSGDGVCDDHQIAWEFAHYGALEGLEVYEKTGEDEYSFRAEYTGGDEYTTVVHGVLTKVETK